MSAQGYEELIILNRKIDELLADHQRLKAEYQKINHANEELKTTILMRDEKIKELEIKYEKVKFTGALLGDEQNAGEAKKKLDDLVREIDKCVALLNR